MPFGRTATSGADRVAKMVSNRNALERRECADPKRRRKLEADPQAWLKHYLAETYYRPFERPHHEIIAGALTAHETKGRFVVAAERGIGKSVVLWGVVLYLKLTDKQPFPICVPWKESAKKQAFRFWRNALCFNPRLAADYPEYCTPFVHSKGVSQRIITTTWKDTGEPTGAQLAIGEGIIVLPSRLGCIGGSTINANPRGLNHPQEDGTVLRPSIVLLDDVQDRKVAKSAQQVLDTVSVINGDVAGCGDAGRDMPMLMACNCIERGDVSAHYLTDPNWHALRIPCVEAWPNGWEDPKHAVHAAWEEFRTRILEEKPMKTWYRKNRKRLVAGMKLSAPSAFVGARDCPDAYYGVIRMYWRMGHAAFLAERQQDPVDSVAESGPYTITVDSVKARATNRHPHEKPDWVHAVLVSSDINPSYAITTSVLGFGQDQSCALLWYGIHKCNIPDALPKPEFDAQLYAELAAHGNEIVAMPNRPEAWAIDCGGKNFDAVMRFSAEAPRIIGLPAIGFRGTGWKQYNEFGKTYIKKQLKREMCHIRSDRKDGRLIKWVPWHADYWKEIAQRATLGDVGAPGALSLPAGQHDDFAAQFCNEKLAGKSEIAGKMAWLFNRTPGKNDGLDATAQGYALAAFYGIGTGDNSAGRQPRRKKARQRIRHIEL